MTLSRTDRPAASPLDIGKDHGDPLTNPAAWPGILAAFAVSGTDGATLAITLAAEAQGLMPTLAQRGDAPVETAIRQRALYAAIHRDYTQGGLAVTAETTLQVGASLPLAGTDGLGGLAAASWLVALGAASCRAVVPASATLDAIVADHGLDWNALAAVNGSAVLAQVFGRGVAITVPGAPQELTPADRDTLAALAERFACAPAALLQANGARSVIAGSALAIPGAVALPDALSTPYTIRAGDTVSAIAAGFEGATAATLVLFNAAMPGTVARDATFDIVVGTITVPVKGAETFAAALETVRANAPAATMADVAAAFDTPGRLAAGALLACPPVLLVSAATSADIAARYGVTGAAFACANAGVPGLIVAGITLVAATGSVTVTPRDTLNSIIGRFEGAVTISALVAANADRALFAAGIRAILPPATLRLTAPIATDGPYPGAVFPLRTDLIVARSPALVDPAFTGTSVESTRATIVAPANDTAFDQALTTALPRLRLAKTEDGELGAIDFGATGIAVDIVQGVTLGERKLARLFGLAPLYLTLVSRTVRVAPLVEGRLDEDAAADQAFQDIDVELWAQLFLADVDRMAATAPALASARALLQDAIPGDLDGIFRRNPADPRAVADPAFATGLAEAKRRFRSTLGDALSPARDIAAVVQYDARVVAPWTTQPGDTAILSGEIHAKADGRRLGPADIDLAKTATFLTLPVSAGSSVMIDPTCTIATLDIGHRPQPAPPGYVRSERLALIATGEALPTALKLDPGPTDVAVPSKRHPAPPIIVAQTATADPLDPAMLASASLWTFGVAYAHAHAPQDRVGIVVERNLRAPVAARLSAAPSDDLFAALARYIAVAPALDDAHTGPDAAAAATTFAEMATDIARLWTVRSPGLLADDAEDNRIASESHPFAATLEASGETLVRYTLARLPDTVGPAIAWPDIKCRTQDGDWVTLAAEPSTGSCAYAPAKGVAVTLPTTREFALDWSGINVGAVRSASVRLDVVRNADLLGPTGPATADAFVYRSMTVAGGIVAPSIHHADPLAMTGTSIEAALQAAFDALLPPATRPADPRIAIGLSYRGTISEPEPLALEIPVALIPDMPLADESAGEIAAALASWQAATDPDPTGAAWIVSLKLHSPDDPGAPLLSLDRLCYPLSASAA